MFSTKTETPILKFVNISKDFNGAKVLKGVSFSINRGELFGLIGRSGAGKTTLLRILIGYYQASSGNIFYENADLTTKIKEIRKIFGFTTQDSCFYEELSVMDNLEYFGKMYGLTKQEIETRSNKLLDLVGLESAKTRRAQDLSGGMQRRLDLAISLIHNPQVLILDEPTTGLDPLLRKEIWSLIKKINRTGVTIIMSSHLLDEMEQLCTNVAMIKAGKLLIKGSPEQLKTFYSRNQEVQLESYPGNYKNLLKELRTIGIATFYPRHEGTKLVFYTPDTYTVLRALPNILIKQKEKLADIRIEKPNLSEVFEAFSIYNK